MKENKDYADEDCYEYYLKRMEEQEEKKKADGKMCEQKSEENSVEQQQKPKKHYLVCHPDTKLKEKSLSVSKLTEETKQIISVLQQYLSEDNIVLVDSISAIQIGIPKKIFVIKKRKEGDSVEVCTYINPKIVSRGDEELINTREGCYSVPGIIASLKCRFKEIQIEARNENWEKVREVLTGSDAILFQHEMDHLVGETIFDKMNRVQKMMKETKYVKRPKKVGIKIKKRMKSGIKTRASLTSKKKGTSNEE